MATKREDAEAITEIDKNHLDRECVNLPGDYRRWAFEAAEAKRDVVEAKARLEVVQAELGFTIRGNPEKYGLDKVTETAITGSVLIQKVYQDAQKEYFKAQHRAELSQAVVWALEHKKRALTLLVDLHGMGYFSDVKMTAEGKTAVEEMTKARVRRRHQQKED